MKKSKAMVKASKRRKKYELKIDDICLKAIADEKCPMVVDVGAWKGHFLKAAYNHNNNMVALAIEPMPENVELLKTIPIKYLGIFNGCAAAEDGTVKLYIAGKKHALVDSSTYKESAEKFGAKNTQEISCEAKSLNTLFKYYGLRGDYHVMPIDVLLMNCEGAEYDIMLGDLSWLRNVKRLYLHMHTKADLFLSQEYINKRFEIIERLQKAGFGMELGMDNMAALSHIIQLWKRTYE